MENFIDAAPWATTFLPAKRPISSLLFLCLLFSSLASVPLAHAESAADGVSADRAPISTAKRTPIVEPEPTLPKSLFSLGLDFWHSTLEKIAPVQPIAPAASVAPEASNVPEVSPASPMHVTTPATVQLIQPTPPAHVIAPFAATAPASLTIAPPAQAIAPVMAAPAVTAKPQITPITPIETTRTLSRIPLQDATQPAIALRAINDPPQEINNEIPRINGIDLTTPADDLWQRMRNGFSMPDLDSPLVADRQAWYLNRPELLRTVLNRSRRYLFFIVGELEKRGMPTELALLPMVESSYNPMAYSPARASGLWQFIPSTGKNYRLQQDWWQDQRRDIIASTGAALDYLQNIYEMHGDWHLALASYNWGEAAVARAVAKNQAKHLPTDYAHINMPQETRYYVPKLQALKNIIAQNALLGVKIDPIPNEPYFDTVDKTANMDVAVAAKLAEMPLNEFLALNPSYNRPVMPASKDSQIVLPTGKVQTFLANLEQHEADEKPLSNWSTHTLKKGERLDRVAARFGMTAAHLKQINGIGARSHVRPGNSLLIPGKGMKQLPEFNPPQDAPETRHIKGRHASKHGSKVSKGSKGHKVTKARAAPRGKAVRHASSGTKRTTKASGSKRRGKR